MNMKKKCTKLLFVFVAVAMSVFVLVSCGIEPESEKDNIRHLEFLIASLYESIDSLNGKCLELQQMNESLKHINDSLLIN